MTDSRFSLLVIQPDDECPVERFGPWLTEAGADVHVVRPYGGEVVPRKVNADGLLVLGGDMGANDDDDHAWLGEVRALLRDAVASDVPTLGICLGSQILATATGGEVARGDAGMESGVVEVRPRPETVDDELTAALPWPMLQGSMHRDAITLLPSAAVWLAESDAYKHQAFRVGASAWGVQFHPELSPERYRRWAEYVRADELTTEHIWSGVAQFDALDHIVRAGAHALALSFASIVRGRASAVAARWV